MEKPLSLFGCALIMLLPVVASAVTMEMVTVGDPGNVADSSDGDDWTPGIQNFGSVGYTYQIGKFEVRNSEYVDFLNAVADTDTYGLYDSGMNSDANGGIIQSGVSGSYTYAVKPGYENMPVVYISYYDAVRFVNWLENGQPAGAQDVGTTETGSYTLSTSGSSTINVSARRAGATWVIPTEDEWYKAAYYDPTAGGTSNYWLYPMRTDSVPYSDQPPGTSSPDPSMAGNFYQNDRLTNGYNDGYAKTGNTGFYVGTNYLTDVGAYTLAGSYYGTFDQGGNAYEWNETIDIYATCQRGGSFHIGGENSLRSSDREDDILPWYGDNIMGFRIVRVLGFISLQISSVATNECRLKLSGTTGIAHGIDVSDNLTNWSPWATVTLPNPTWSTNIILPSDQPRLFWRARLAQ